MRFTLHHVVRSQRRTPLAALVLGLAVRAAAGPASPPEATPASPNRIVRDGVVVEFSIGPAGGAAGGALREGDFAQVSFSTTDAASGKPVPGLSPAAWMDMADVVVGPGGAQKECKEKIALYLKGVVGIRPLVDLNSYYLLVLNKDASISVIDPIVSMTGNTSLYATAVLKRPGADWAQPPGGKRLFVSMPKADEVAVVDTDSFKVQASVPAGRRPTRLAAQPDGRALWVGNDAEGEESGVTIIDAASLEVVGRVATGRGHHELAFSADGRLALVTNRDAGTVTVVDVDRRVSLGDVEVGGVPIALATSSLSRLVYVAEARSGTILALDPAQRKVVARLQARPGLGPTRFTQDGRWGFTVNPAEHAVHVFDATTNRVVHTIEVGGQPYQLNLSRAFAYVRLLDSDRVKMINLLTLGEGKTPIVQAFGAGTGAPMAAGELGLADAISPAASEAAVFVLNPADGNTYFYMEGMNAPSGSFSSYGHQAQAVTVVDRSLKETAPGVYTGTVRLPAAGHYDVAFLLDSPRVLHCFGADATANPALQGTAGLAVDYLDFPARLESAGDVPVRFRLRDDRTRAPRTGLGDVQLSWHEVPGRRLRPTVAREVGEGIYEATLQLDRAGVYYVFLSVASLQVAPSDVPFRTVRVAAASRPGP